MIIDLILDRKEGEPYNPKDFYTNVLAYEDVFKFEPTISKAMDYGEEEDVKRALCDYINRQNYNPSICDYINSVNWLTSSKKVVKSSVESIELAFDRAEYCCKKLFKSAEGGRYNKWYCYGAEFGQNYAWFKVEHTDYSVRLSFEFMDTGFVYVDGYFTNGSSYDKKTITSWKFENESEDDTADKVKDVLDRFFDEGINILRGEEVYNSRKVVKSSMSEELEQALADLGDAESDFELVGLVQNILNTHGMSEKYHDFCEEIDKAKSWKGMGDVAEKYIRMAIKSSRRPVKSSTTWVAGKSENGNKSFYCEDGKFYAEEDYSRPSIKVFNNKDDAEKIAKRSKSGFIQVLDEYDD